MEKYKGFFCESADKPIDSNKEDLIIENCLDPNGDEGLFYEKNKKIGISKNQRNVDVAKKKNPKKQKANQKNTKAVEEEKEIKTKNPKKQKANQKNTKVVEEEKEIKTKDPKKQKANSKNTKIEEEEKEEKKGIFHARKEYKPFRYEWAYDAAMNQQKAHWLPREVPLDSDLIDWTNNLSGEEKSFLQFLFHFFTQTEIEVNKCYMKKYMNSFHHPELQLMFSAFSNIESIHTLAYSYLIDEIVSSVGGCKTYTDFASVDEIKNQHDYINKFYCSNTDPAATATAIAAFAAFTEGLHLFSGFIMLLAFPQHNLMKGMGQIVAWAVKDESLHVDSMIKLYKEILLEFPHVDTKEHRASIVDICKKMVDLEIDFVKLCFKNGCARGLNYKDVVKYVKYLANGRMRQLGLKDVYRNAKTNPLPWSEWVLKAPEHANFFENRVTEYSKASTTGSWDDVFSSDCESCQ